MSSIFEKTDYCLNKNNISAILKGSLFKNYKDFCQTTEETVPFVKKVPIKKKMFIKEKDKLFWMLYIFENGDYTMLGKNTYSFEMKEKTKLIKQVKEHKQELKHFKLKTSDVEADLLYSKRMNITTFFTLLIVKNINFLYYTENIIYQWKKEGNDKMFILNHNTKDNIYVNEDKALTDEYFKILGENRLIVENLKKPIRGVSSYKVGEIKEICKKLNINIMKNSNKNFSKKELYEKIVQKII
tara:strand:- start:2910 stop:3635 length:726 start_codon:yes stop_codon:yes gene_type:complete